MSHPLEEYAMIADGRSAALVHASASIDWLCWPSFPSRALFAALLGDHRNGHWQIAPTCDYRSRREYAGNSLVLRTEFSTATGQVLITDWMSFNDGTRGLFRKVEGLSGQVELGMNLVVRFDYGSIHPWVTTDGSGVYWIVAGPDAVEFKSSFAASRNGGELEAKFMVSAGEVQDCYLLWKDEWILGKHHEIDLNAELDRTLKHWEEWARKCRYKGDYKDLVIRSLLILKGLIYQPTGSIVAAPTTSLPEDLGGVRNWDYRFSWIRDATYTLYAFANAGYLDEAEAWRKWLVRTIAGSPEQLNIMYGIHGERRLPELTLDWLPGYGNSSPVRTGNAAYTQLQLDIFGELMDALHLARRRGMEPQDTSWKVQYELLNFLETEWQKPDEGIWETRGPRKDFTHSKVMAWVAFDRAIKAIEHFRLPGDLDKWKVLRARIRADVCEHGFNKILNSFTQAFGSENVDASLLMIPLVGFLPADDPRMVGTIRKIERDLLHDGFVRRYKLGDTRDGLPGSEGAFLACSYWLADNYVLIGEREKARDLFERLADLANDVGLMSEEYDPEYKRLVGNFPQALTHISLVNTAFNLSEARGPAHDRC